MTASTGVVMMNMGGPDSNEDVRPYLENIFRDPHILDMPFGFLIRPFLAPRIAKKREPESIRRYNLIGGSTPLNAIAREQSEILEEQLGNIGIDAVAAPAMRYWHPFVEDLFKRWQSLDLERVVFLSMYPHYCKATTYSCLVEFNKYAKKLLPDAERVIIDRWFDLPEYCAFLAAEANKALAEYSDGELRNTAVLFSSHSIPYKLYKSGDPYKREIEHSCELITSRLNREVRCELGWQSSFGPARWLEPDSTDVVSNLVTDGVENLIVVPLGFVAENIETEWDIEIDLREHAEGAGIKRFNSVSCPNADKSVLDGLARLVQQRTEG